MRLISIWAKLLRDFNRNAGIISIFALVIALAAWLFPREPAPANVDPNFIYKNGSPVGHVRHYDKAALGTIISLDVDQSAKISPNDIIEFGGKRCLLKWLEERSVDKEKLIYAYTIHCDIM
jgi:hypothetical protein